jgi:hypothetical protein
MQNQSASIEDLFHKTGEYIETRVELVRLKAIDKSSEIVSSITASLVVLLIVMLCVFTFTIGIALWLGEVLGKSFYGFFAVALFYAIVALVFYLLRSKWIKTPITKMIIDKVIK